MKKILLIALAIFAWASVEVYIPVPSGYLVSRTYLIKSSVLLRIFLKNPKWCCGYSRKICNSNAIL